MQRINLHDATILNKTWHLQQEAYKVEAQIIGFDQIPPLLETRKQLQGVDEIFYGYWIGDELCGFISYQLVDGVIDICRLVTKPTHFKQGIAQALLGFVERNEQTHILRVSTGATNGPACSFYQKHGFRKVGEKQITVTLRLIYFEKGL
ncbi:hypothetical protein AB990_11480 [Alkalihalobacillus pseudalcaliphilus]|nr:hypothetical protein AB990_11480 [Alkalihalobacillus pseudalcaliphilus]